MKICNKCKNEYVNNFFEKGRGQCKNCMKDNRRKWIKNYRLNHTTDYKFIESVYHANWYLLNKENIKNSQKEYQRNRKAKDPVFKIRSNISTLISRTLKRQNLSKGNNSCLNHLSYTINDLVKYIENLFEPWMTWSNYGKFNAKTWNDHDINTWTWNIDHIIPQSNLPYTSMEDDNFKKCWNLNNLRPLSAKQNWLDGHNKSRHNSFIDINKST